MAQFALQHGILPPTINFKTADPECDLDIVPNQARQAQVEYALSNNLGSRVMGTEFYRLVRGARAGELDDKGWETDLFAGV